MIEYFTYVIDSDLQVQTYFIPIHSFIPSFPRSFIPPEGSDRKMICYPKVNKLLTSELVGHYRTATGGNSTPAATCSMIPDDYHGRNGSDNSAAP